MPLVIMIFGMGFLVAFAITAGNEPGSPPEPYGWRASVAVKN